jgi:hypothetical protein
VSHNEAGLDGSGEEESSKIVCQGRPNLVDSVDSNSRGFRVSDSNNEFCVLVASWRLVHF